MKVKVRYIIYCIAILLIGAIIPVFLTHSKYIANVSIGSDITVANMIFELKKQDAEPEIYSINKGEEITASFKLCNIDENNNINQLDLKYYIKIIDDNENENLPLEISVDNYEYIEYKIDEHGNIIDIDGNIVDEEGTILEKRETPLTEDENEELQSSLKTIKKGYGKIELAYDGVTEDEEEINLKIKCPENYNGSNQLTYKIKIIAEELSNDDFTYEETVDLDISIEQEENNNEAQNNSETTNSNEIQNNSVTTNSNETRSNVESEVPETSQNSLSQNEGETELKQQTQVQVQNTSSASNTTETEDNNLSNDNNEQDVANTN